MTAADEFCGGSRISDCRGTDERAPLRSALIRHDAFDAWQTAGRFYPMACVALEITQRCNLDCSLCYLSDTAEMAHDVPLPVLLGRIDMLARRYGPGTSVQITGGDPTLRAPADLETLCREIRARGLRSCLMTNGIKASRALLQRLAAAGLDDIAFHVDLTQERAGYDSESALHPVRDEYIRRTRGLGLRVLFNTTIFDGNFGELPALAAFFRDRAHRVTLASFQIQAATGRGVLGQRAEVLTRQSVLERIEDGLGARIFGDVGVGHPDCNAYAAILTAGGQVVSPLCNRALIADIFAGLEAQEIRRDGHLDIARTAARLALRNPLLALRALWQGAGLVWALRRGLWQGRGRLSRLSFLVHNFMDAEALDPARCESCVFMVATETGPLSMCQHNAERDAHIFAPARVATGQGDKWWSAATGALTDTPDFAEPGEMPFKRLKGRQRARARAKL